MNDFESRLPEKTRAAVHALLKRAPADLIAVARRPLNSPELEILRTEAEALFRLKLEASPLPLEDARIGQAWHETVSELYARDRFRDVRIAAPPALPTPEALAAKKLPGYIRTALMPMLVTKSFMLYFGLNYAMYPGDGYGYGLLASISVTLGSFAYFVWVNRYESEQRGEEGPATARRD